MFAMESTFNEPNYNYIKYKDPSEAFLILNNHVLSGEFELNISKDLEALLEKVTYYEIDPMNNPLTIINISDENLLKDLAYELIKLFTNNPRLQHYCFLWKCQYKCTQCKVVRYAIQISASLSIHDITVLCTDFSWTHYTSLSMGHQLTKCSSNLCVDINTCQRSDEEILFWPRYAIIRCSSTWDDNKLAMKTFFNKNKQCFQNDPLKRVKIAESSKEFNLVGYLSNPMNHVTCSIMEEESNKLITIDDETVRQRSLDRKNLTATTFESRVPIVTLIYQNIANKEGS
jgi:hypothetical protein